MADRLRRAWAWVDSRLDLSAEADYLGKAFPAEDSFLLGEVALFCFLMLVLTGMFLGFFFEPSTSDVEYDGSVDEYQGEELPEAFVSVLNITYEVPYGMFLRRLHHWAAHLFVASLSLHMLRVFFHGAYANPREPNWVVGGGLAISSMFAAYTGYALPYDEFASTATGIGYSIAKSVPIFGDILSQIVFGGEYPSSATLPRFYFIHVFLLPVVIAGLIAVHMAILVRQKHTEAPREADVTGGRLPVDRDDGSVVVGLPAFPNQAAISAVVFFLTLGVLSLLAGFLPVHNVAEYGPNDPASTPSLIMPDWFLMWVFGFLKVMPSWMSFTVPGTDIHVSTEFLSGMVLPGIVFALLFAWPFIDSYDEQRHFSMDPLARPWQTAVGVTGVVFVMIASIAGMNTIAADITGLSTGVLNPLLLGAMILGPLLAGGVTYVVLDRYDADDPTDGGRRPTTADGGAREAAGPAANATDAAVDPPDDPDAGPPDGGRDA
ncbi:menaquinol-cytochrome c reductase cytochrome b subunit precursor [Halomicrobium zhouii]|uniref:Menaquinol-cytochrome c reductase cytochrome b subunit n=1 Tax=Halomicrobium zhouii TaxID=767519 RepID=A0A1I6K7N1_9EURY|nr:cytochrome bc complex cytochrome b subunit [Halomicrobium zhouii]SFR87243.1 menaquinol-cytochrome c reductase cytochrome b subunit precursor [Halomicrobium zhouii]